MCAGVPLALEQHGFEVCRSTYTWVFSIGTVNVFSIPYVFLTNISFTFIVRIQYIIHITYKTFITVYVIGKTDQQ